MRGFQDHLGMLRWPPKLWLAALKQNTEGALRAQIDHRINLESSEALAPQVRYEAVRVAVFAHQGSKYACFTYFRRLTRVDKGARDVDSLARYIWQLALNYEAAREREACQLINHPEISFLVFIDVFLHELPQEVQQGIVRFRSQRDYTQTRWEACIEMRHLRNQPPGLRRHLLVQTLAGGSLALTVKGSARHKRSYNEAAGSKRFSSANRGRP